MVVALATPGGIAQVSEALTFVESVTLRGTHNDIHEDEVQQAQLSVTKNHVFVSLGRPRKDVNPFPGLVGRCVSEIT